MGSMKKKGLLAIIGGLLVLFSFVLVIIFSNKKTKNDAAETLKSKYSSLVYLYGEELPYISKQLNGIQVASIDKNSVIDDTNCFYKVVIINDVNGTVDISDESWMLLMNLVECNGFDMLYFGEKCLPDLYRLGFAKNSGMLKNEFALGYLSSIHYGMEGLKTEFSNRYALHGLFSKEDWQTISFETMQNNIISDLLFYAREKERLIQQENMQ